MRESTPQELLAFFRMIRPDVTERVYMALDLDDAPSLRALALDCVEVRGRVAVSKYTPTQTLQKLARDSSPFVRARVAANRNAPMKTLRALSQDSCKRVLTAILTTPQGRSTPILRKLADNPEAWEILRGMPLPNDIYEKVERRLNERAWRSK